MRDPLDTLPSESERAPENPPADRSAVVAVALVAALLLAGLVALAADSLR